MANYLSNKVVNITDS